MIVYFADRKMNILGQASTGLLGGLTVTDDTKIEDVECGVASFECTVHFDDETREKAKAFTAVGNYILRSHNGENEFYTIIDSEADSKDQTVYIYAEDAGLDLLNEVVGSYEADKAYNIAYYVNKYAYDSGFEIGINEVSSLTRKLSWDGEATVTERLASVATQFDCEISYSFAIKGLTITHKYINIHKNRGKDIGVQLRLNYEIDRIITKQSIENLATALLCEGGTPENKENPITLSGYKYDDGDFYVDGQYLKSRKALKRWSRYVWNNEPNKIDGQQGHIVRRYSYDTTSQSELCNRAISELKKLCEIEVNYEVDISKLPDSVRLGDRVNIIDDSDNLYVSARVLKLETSVSDQSNTATIGEYLIKGSGINQKVADLAANFAKISQSAARALTIAHTAKTNAEAAQTQADKALTDSANAQATANAAQETANKATQSAQEAQTAAGNAQTAVDAVEKDVAGIQTTVANAEAAAEQAKAAAATAEEKVTETLSAVEEIKTQAANAEQSATDAIAKAEQAVTNSNTAKSTAENAISQAQAAATTAAAAKLDAENAQKEIDALGDNLTTLESTMQADYARKTDLTEAEASLQTQITQNAAGIASNASSIVKIDETANNAKTQAEQAQTTAQQAQTEATQAQADAAAAQTAADDAALAAATAQSEADKAKAAAADAQSVADKADADLTAAKADLATVQSRVDATEEDIAAAQLAVNTAQAAADKAKADAATAQTAATTAQSKADQAALDATAAQETANDASNKATIAQKTADEAKGDASAAQATADEAKAAANTAQLTANTAKENATAAQATADRAALDAAAAQSAADDADAKAQQAAADLATAQKNLADVTSRVDATEEEVAAAQADVIKAQAAADAAKANAATAQTTADTAKANAQAAQTAADNAKSAADQAQADADAAQAAADAAQADVDALTVRVTKAETDIVQTSEQIKLLATKEEVTQTLGGYYTKEETDAAITVESTNITQRVSQTYTTKEEFNNLEVGGRNLLRNSSFSKNFDLWNATNAEMTSLDDIACGHITCVLENVSQIYQRIDDKIDWENLEQEYTFSADICLENFVKGTTSPYLALHLSGHYDDNGTTKYVGAVTVSGNPFIITYNGVGWVRLKWVVKFDHILDILNIYIYSRDIAGDVYFKNLKLEKGNKATDWAPAPEDMATAEEVTNAQTSADAAQADANEAHERISTAESVIQQLSDSISMLVTDSSGASLMTQTENGWTFSTAQLQDSIDGASKGIDELNKELGSTNGVVDALQKAVDELGVTAEYVRIGVYEGEPCIELGESDSDFKLLITNTRIMFMEGSDVPTYISNKTLHTKKINVEEELRQGSFVWILHNGNLGLMWKGSDA